MDTLPYLLPWILVIFAVATTIAVKLTDIKSVTGIAITSVLSLLMILVAVYANVISHQKSTILAEKDTALAEIEAWKYKHLDELTLLIAQLRPPEDEDLALLDQLADYGWRKNNPTIQRMRLAHQARERIRSHYKAEEPMLIKGIPLSVDHEIVELALRQVGFTVIPYRDDETPEEQANILYYGRDMKLDEIKLAALTLVQAGILLKAIKPFPKVTQGNLRAIKIEWNKYYVNRAPMEPEELEASEQFK